jgi:hypothetical protein
MRRPGIRGLTEFACIKPVPDRVASIHSPGIEMAEATASVAVNVVPGPVTAIERSSRGMDVDRAGDCLRRRLAKSISLTLVSGL